MAAASAVGAGELSNEAVLKARSARTFTVQSTEEKGADLSSLGEDGIKFHEGLRADILKYMNAKKHNGTFNKNSYGHAEVDEFVAQAAQLAEKRFLIHGTSLAQIVRTIESDRNQALKTKLEETEASLTEEKGKKTPETPKPKHIKGELHWGYMILASTITASLTAGLIFWMMERKQKKILTSVVQQKQQIAQLQQALQAAGSDGSGGYGDAS